MQEAGRALKITAAIMLSSRPQVLIDATLSEAQGFAAVRFSAPVVLADRESEGEPLGTIRDVWGPGVSGAGLGVVE